MASPALMLLVRFHSGLSDDEAMRIMEERAPQFRALGGLQQKYYLRDPASGDFAGLYLWESAEALGEYSESELRATIAESYQAQGKPRVEVYEVMSVLREPTD